MILKDEDGCRGQRFERGRSGDSGSGSSRRTGILPGDEERGVQFSGMKKAPGGVLGLDEGRGSGRWREVQKRRQGAFGGVGGGGGGGGQDGGCRWRRSDFAVIFEAAAIAVYDDAIVVVAAAVAGGVGSCGYKARLIEHDAGGGSCIVIPNNSSTLCFVYYYYLFIYLFIFDVEEDVGVGNFN